MKLKLAILSVHSLQLTFSKVNAVAVFDTLYVCLGESIQLQTTPNEYSYQWSPSENISSVDIYNPILTPLETSTYIVTVEPNPVNNLIYNDDFSLGNVGFDSDYFYAPDGSEFQGFYSVFTSPTQFNSWFGDCEDHSSSANGLMLIVDGATTLNQTAWCQQVAVEENKLYTFSSWVTNIYWQAPPLIQFYINGAILGTPMQIPGTTCVWELFSADWFSSNINTATICVETLNIDVDGNDFALDDI